MCWRFVVQIILALSWISLHFSYQYNVHSTSRFCAANRVNHLLATDLSRPSASITSPVAINKIITTVFSPDFVKNETTFLRLKVYLEKNAQSMNDVNAITLLHRCAKFKKNVTALISMRRIVSLIQAGRPNAQGTHSLLSLNRHRKGSLHLSSLTPFSLIRNCECALFAACLPCQHS